MSPRFVITGVLSVLIGGTIALIGWETDWGGNLGTSDNRLLSSKRASLDTKILPPFTLEPLSPGGTGYRETVERPLFIPTRRPAPAGSGTQMAMKKGQFRLAGTTVSENASVAYLFETSNNKTHRINKGAEINGIVVDSVTPTRVVLKQGDETEELLLRTSASPKPPPPPPVAAATPQGQPPQPGQPGQQVIPAPGAPPGMPPSAVAGFAPPGVVAQGANPLAQSGAGANNPNGAPPAPGTQNPANPAAAAAAQDSNQPAARRRRFQNLPQ